MRHVYENPKEAAAKGAAARKLMLSRYSPDVVGRLVAAEVKRIKDSIRCDFVPGGRALYDEIERHLQGLGGGRISGVIPGTNRMLN